VLSSEIDGGPPLQQGEEAFNNLGIARALCVPIKAKRLGKGKLRGRRSSA